MLLDPHRLEEQLRAATAIDAAVRDAYLTFAHAHFPGGTTVRPAGHGYIERELRFEAKGDWLYSAVLNQKWVLWYFRKPALNAGLIDPGKTKGFSRPRADFYVPNDRPKKLWVKELRKDATRILRADELPAECRRGAQSDDDGVLPLTVPQLESLHECFCKVPDPRAGNSIFHIGSMLSIVAMAILSGHRNIQQIVRFADRIRMEHRRALGLPRFSKDSSYCRVPSYSAFYNLLKQLDIDAFGQCLSQWLAARSGTLPAALALDGKFIRDTVGIVCLANHESGIPRAMIKASKKEGDGHDCEIKSAQRMIRREKDLSHTTITADAMHCQRQTARDIVERGGEFIFQVKDNQKSVHAASALKTRDIAPLLPRPKKLTDA